MDSLFNGRCITNNGINDVSIYKISLKLFYINLILIIITNGEMIVIKLQIIVLDK